MALDTYRAKRDFTVTAEPKGETAVGKGHAYLIQKHAARRLHYDLRLEMDGVLKSWAVTRGPSLVPGEKRLAVHVEDHPLAYGSFEGTIPKGQYGGGTVMLWDSGSWIPKGDPRKGYKKGHLDFELRGEKLSGHWHLVRMPKRRGETQESWLLFKADDAAARTKDAPDILEEAPDSVKTGRTLDEIAEDAPAHKSRTKTATKTAKAATTTKTAKGTEAKASEAETMAEATRPSTAAKSATPPAPAQPSPTPARAKARGKQARGKQAAAAKLPDFLAPQLATLVAKAPAGAGWIHEIKFDGYRLQVRIDHNASGKGRLRLLTRSGLDWTERFGTALADALLALPAQTALIDGELVVETPSGASHFAALQEDLSEGRSDRFVFYAFDLLHLDGRDLTGAKLLARKAALAGLFKDAPAPLRLSEPFEVDGATLLRHACRLSLEGLVSKRADGRYRSGRGKDWVKSKCAERQEFVIAGFVPSTAMANAIGSLVLGVHEDGKLRPVGRVGTGFSHRVAAELYRDLSTLTRTRSPFADKLTAEARRGVTFVKPERVAEVEFRGWTGDQNLRHAAYRGLREDKPASEIVREAPAPDTSATGSDTSASSSTSLHSSAIGKSAIKLTHPDRIYWPEDGITKEGLAAYYAEIWRFIAPHIVARPLALLRCPDGISKACFFQKHSWRGMNTAIKVARDTDGEEMLFIEDRDGLLALVQAGALEIHPWGAPLGGLETPDTMIFDLDPSPELGWADVVAGAKEVRWRLEQAGLPAFVKTSGGKGLHVVVPLEPKAGWDAVKGFAKAIAEAMAGDDPDRYIAVATKAKREGRIFIDYLRNGRGATAIAPYGTRARAGAGVAMPVAWEEIDSLSGAAQYTLENAPARLAHLDRDPWEDFRASATPLPELAKRRRGRR
ncbi:DNA ligase D [Ancylobacter sp. SL191]|uniref:DNA ligase D n=1 Tax=Ancylobacter sp. SL191 TaxID=2995166 RepID=UPI00226F5E8C|nr:DNA ligase D [Ancylobacter sp. SL191]WAC27425.1 DNA ligase D [Ancylobacter sp. SL191]